MDDGSIIPSCCGGQRLLSFHCGGRGTASAARRFHGSVAPARTASCRRLRGFLASHSTAAGHRARRRSMRP